MSIVLLQIAQSGLTLGIPELYKNESGDVCYGLCVLLPSLYSYDVCWCICYPELMLYT